MNPESASFLGFVLLLVGIALAIIGYAIYLNLRANKASDSPEGEEDSNTANSILDEDSSEISAKIQDEDSGEGNLANQVLVSPTDPDADEPQKEGAELLEMESMDPSIDDNNDEKSSIFIPDEPELIPAAMLFREGVTGRIIVKVGDRQYSDVQSLKNSNDWSRVKSLSSDLLDWIEEKPAPSSEHSTHEKIEQAPFPNRQVSDSDSMIEQINKILDKKVKTMQGEEREIKLVEGEVGALEVRVGLEKFPTDDVPYANVRDLIQDAVSQWENSQ